MRNRPIGCLLTPCVPFRFLHPQQPAQDLREAEPRSPLAPHIAEPSPAPGATGEKSACRPSNDQRGHRVACAHQVPGSVRSALLASPLKPHEVSGPTLSLPQTRKPSLSKGHLLAQSCSSHTSQLGSNLGLDGGRVGPDHRQAVLGMRPAPPNPLRGHLLLPPIHRFLCHQAPLRPPP